MLIRPAEQADVPAIAGLWNLFVRETSVTFTTEEKTPEGLCALIARRQDQGRAFFVLRDGDEIGFATYDQFRSGPGYAWAMEHTILISAGLRRRGAGRALLRAIEDHARTRGAHTLFAAVSGENPDGIAFHSRAGFAVSASYPEAGRKFGRWIDLVLMMKFL